MQGMQGMTQSASPLAQLAAAAAGMAPYSPSLGALPAGMLPTRPQVSQRRRPCARPPLCTAHDQLAVCQRAALLQPLQPLPAEQPKHQQAWLLAGWGDLLHTRLHTRAAPRPLSSSPPPPPLPAPPPTLLCPLPRSPSTLQSFSPVTNARDNAPCNTLFIGAPCAVCHAPCAVCHCR
jgi:hypothetical protein